MTARDRFNAELRDLIDDGRTLGCANDDRFTSESASERAAVRGLCRRCPLIDTCRALADEERPKHGIWAGVDRSPRTPKTKETPQHGNL